MQRINVFAGPYLERSSHLRSDPDWFASALIDRNSRVMPVWNSRSLIVEGAASGALVPSAAAAGDRRTAVEAADAAAPHAALLELAQVPEERRNSTDLILLGRFDDANLFAYEIEGADPPPSPAGTRFEDLRTVAALMPPEQAGVLGYARAMVTWRRTHRYCGRCGAKTLPDKGGHVLVCTNPVCRHESFPRLDPAIIVLVSDGERALLGRQAAWPAGRYSTIAGFVEPGESLEDAVAREVEEETGVRVDRIDYHSSQPWPFPSSLMLGFLAHAATHEIHLQDRELEDARWFTRADIESGVPLLPPPVSISYRLIEHWFDANAARPLREVQRPPPWPR
ncbi:MAG TPA: NAD(+) diphosphatase [Steroidobacteraceae bacterium]|nr:NAD(+) diphosphatase [Steroidobacteraceae bacterium]